MSRPSSHSAARCAVEGWRMRSGVSAAAAAAAVGDLLGGGPWMTMVSDGSEATDVTVVRSSFDASASSGGSLPAALLAS